MEARHSTALQLARLVEQSVGTSTLNGQHRMVRMSPIPATYPQIPSGTVENHIPLLPVKNFKSPSTRLYHLVVAVA
jgi:hypothetical protein